MELGSGRVMDYRDADYVAPVTSAVSTVNSLLEDPPFGITDQDLLSSHPLFGWLYAILLIFTLLPSVVILCMRVFKAKRPFQRLTPPGLNPLSAINPFGATKQEEEMKILKAFP